MDLAAKIEELGRTVKEFRDTNEKAIKEAKEFGAPKAETETKLQKIEGGLQSLEKKIEDMNAALARTGQEGDEKQDLNKKELKKYQDACLDFMRKGEELPAEMQAWAHKTMSVDSQVGGGFFIQPELSAEIVKKVNESTPMRELASVISISTSSLKANSDLSARTATWRGERESRAEGSSPTVNQDEIFVHEMDCNPGATQTFLDDAAVNVEQWLGDYAAEAFALAEATAFISGSGVGRPRGILSYLSGSTYGSLERIATEGTGSIVGNDVINLQDSLKEPYQKNATFLMNRLTKSAIRKIKDGSQYIWQPGLQAGAPDTLLGRPVRLAADLPSALTALTDGVMLYGDFKQWYTIVDRVGIRVLRDPYSSKPKVVFFTTKRVGGGVRNYEAGKILQIHS